MRIGSIQLLTPENINDPFKLLRTVGLNTCQLCCWQPDFLTEKVAKHVKKVCDDSNFKPCALWSGYSGICHWNFSEGPLTLGLVPPEFRAMRIAELKHLADMAALLGLPAIITHCGFIPENMLDANYMPTVMAIANVAAHCKQLGIQFWFETGQETPVVLLRTIMKLHEFGYDNLGINLDPANLLMYGKGNPLDALEVFGKYVRNLHIKDGLPPTDGFALGREVQVGEGRVNFPALLKRLRSLDFDGELIIEREIAEGEEQNRDVMNTIKNLKKWWKAGAPC